jgi:DNA-binding transcriptional regulator YiaG
MTGKRKFKSDAFEAIHSSASAIYKVGAIDKRPGRQTGNHHRNVSWAPRAA